MSPHDVMLLVLVATVAIEAVTHPERRNAC